MARSHGALSSTGGDAHGVDVLKQILQMLLKASGQIMDVLTQIFRLLLKASGQHPDHL